MITTVALNPSFDRTVRIDRLSVGGLNRVRSSTSVAAGKGMNVAKAVCALGGKARYVGFLYEDGAAVFADALHRAGVESDCVICPGAVRVNIKVMDAERGEVTEFNEKGTPVCGEQLARMRQKVAENAAISDFTVLTGSIPPGCPENLYYEMMAGQGRFVLDADAGRLREGLKAHPYFIKPNRFELEQLVDRRLGSWAEVRDAAQELIRGGVSVVAVSLGGDGAMIADANAAYAADALRLDVRSTVGAGDSMVAGALVALSEGRPLDEVLRWGMAAASARCATEADAPIAQTLCEEMRERIAVRAL